MVTTSLPARPEAAVRAWPGTDLRDGVTLVGLVLGAVTVCLGALAWTGGAAVQLLVDAGPGVRWGLPAARVLSDLSAALTIGILVVAAVGLSASRPAPVVRALRLASVAAGAWAVATVAVALLTYADLSGRPLDDPTYGAQLVTFVREIDAGRGLAVTAAVALAVNLGALVAVRLRATGLLALLALTALVPPALAGHAASAQGSHETAVTALGLHLLGVSVWIGGLAGVVLLRGTLGPDLPVLARRYSRLALGAFVAVAGSGALTAWVHLGGLGALGSRYGVLVLGKVGALTLLGFVGALHRRRSLVDLDAGRPGAFVRLAVVEGAVMAFATGLAVALARSPSPIPDGGTAVALTPTELATGYPMPPEPTLTRWLTTWQPDLLWLVLVALGAVLYTEGVRRLRRRGDRWPLPRTVTWCVGLAILVWVTCGAPAAYGRVLFSAHMVGHMTLSMAAPLFLVLGAPVTLLLRAVRPRGDGSRGPREWTLAALDSTPARVLGHPVVVASFFAGSLVLFYFSPLFELALTTHVGHELMHLHFLFAGCLLAWLMIGIDPGPRRPAPPLRLLILFVTMAFHAFFGIALIGSKTVLAEQYWVSAGRTWGRSLLADQAYGGGIAWGLGELPTLALAVILAVQWARSDTREARRRDRAADRDGDAELDAYNAMLARIAATDGARRD
jgi:putative copper resistance protein D